MTIKHYVVKNVPVKSLKFDDKNPNKMSDKELESLWSAMKRFGYLAPIIINEKNQVVDGEHRAMVYRDMGIKEIPAYIVPALNDDTQRRLARQVMNKLRGEHDPKLDLEELEEIYKTNQQALQDLLSIDDARMATMRELISQPSKDEWAQILEDNTNMDAVKDEHQVLLRYGDKDFKTFNEAIDSAEQKKGTTAEKLILVLREWLKSKPKQNKSKK